MVMENSIYLKSVPIISESHGSKLLTALYEQQKKSHLCDLSLVVENVSFPAHKCVLAAHSDYFYALFDQGKQSDEAGSKACNVTTIHLSSITLNTFIPILHYLYTSKLHVFSENVRDIMRSARKLQISAILKACEKLLDDNIVLPSVHEVCNKQSSDTIVTQSTSSESVLYVDLRAEDDDNFSVSQSASAFSKPSQSDNMGLLRTTNDYAAEQSSDAKQKVGRAQKKKGFPKKLQQFTASNVVLSADQQLSPVHSISTVSPASIFGRVVANQSSKAKSLTSPVLPLITSSDTLSKVANPLAMEPLPFENNLDALGTIFGADSALIVDNLHNDNLHSSTSHLDKTPATLKTSTTADSLQLQSVFSISPKLSPHKAPVSSGEWNRLLQDARSCASMHVSTALPSTLPTTALITSPTSLLQTPGNCPPSVYSCKECLKYFATLSEAIHHFYAAHSNNGAASTSRQQTLSLPISAQRKLKSVTHTCPHCGRNFNNKNNLKRHILIKHTSDKRFKCTVCSRRYAIRQSLQYHIRSVHGCNTEGVKADLESRDSPSSTSSYPFEPLSSMKDSPTDTFSFSVNTGATSNSFINTHNQLCSASGTSTTTSPATYLATVSLVADDPSEQVGEKNEANMPTIQHVESIRAISISEDENQQQSKNSNNIEQIDSMTSSNDKVDDPFKAHNDNLPPKIAALRQPASSTSPGRFALAGAVDLPILLPADSGYQHNEVTPRLHRCDHCSRIFSTVHAYSRHRRSCHKHECPICNRGFSQMGNMRRHIKIFHCEQKPYECHICHKAYGIKQSFRYHMRDKHGLVDAAKPDSRSYLNALPSSTSQQSPEEMAKLHDS